MYSTTVGCDCIEYRSVEQARFENHRYSTLIAIVEVVEIYSSAKFRVQTLEVFKGIDVPAELDAEIRSTCSEVPNNVGEKWIVYSNPNNEGAIDFSRCSHSRSLNHWFPPITIAGLFLSNPPKHSDDISEVEGDN